MPPRAVLVEVRCPFLASLKKTWSSSPRPHSPMELQLRPVNHAGILFTLNHQCLVRPSVQSVAASCDWKQTADAAKCGSFLLAWQINGYQPLCPRHESTRVHPNPVGIRAIPVHSARSADHEWSSTTRESSKETKMSNWFVWSPHWVACGVGADWSSHTWNVFSFVVVDAISPSLARYAVLVANILSEQEIQQIYSRERERGKFDNLPMTGKGEGWRGCFSIFQVQVKCWEEPYVSFFPWKGRQSETFETERT